MELPALAIQQPDLGRSLATVAAIKSANLQNKLLEAKVAREGQVQGLVGQALGGDTGQVAGEGAPSAPGGGTMSGNINMSAVKKLFAVDPQAATAIMDFAGKADKVQAEAARRGAEQIAKPLLSVMQAPPEQRPMVYAQMLGQMQQSGMQFKNPPPAQWDENWANTKILEALSIDQALAEKNKAADLQKPMTGIGKLEADLRAGRITKQQYDQQVAIDSKPLVQMNNTQETERSKAYGKKTGEYYGETFTKLQESSRAAASQNNSLDQLEGLLANVTTGTAAEQRANITRAAKTLGMDVNLIGDLPSAEAAQAISNEMALQLRNPAGGAGLPGAMSDSDRQFLTEIPPSIGKTPEGKKMLIALRKKVNQRSMDVAKLSREYEKRNGRLDAGFEDELQDFSKKNPLFSKEDFARAKTVNAAAGGDLLSQAKDAIAKGAPKDAVIKRLKDSGVEVPEGF